ncbi:MAG: 3-phosphoshikimate 1-carboxyvinyltransferase [Bacteroidia bacterium]|nr:3-phosphoshikimate 1-carboxyvinyltransferase [Bacteroidia bacterium]
MILKYLAGDNLTDIFKSTPQFFLPDDVQVMFANLITESDEKNAADAGTVMRFLTAVYALQGKTIFIRGNGRMYQRPIGELVNALQHLGADIAYEQQEGFPPLKINPASMHGGEVALQGSVSSQFISALLLIAPYLNGGLTIKFINPPVSSSYIQLTLDLMKQWGAKVHTAAMEIKVEQGMYTKNLPLVFETDWSSASYWYMMVSACKGSRIELPGLFLPSFQGDSIVATWMQELGVKTEVQADRCVISSGELPECSHFEKDFSSYPDLVPAFAVTCALHGIPAVFSGVAHLKLKESDRITSLTAELQKVNCLVTYTDDGTMRLTPGNFTLPNEVFHTWNDHRIAMSMAGFACRVPIELNDETVVSKSYPGFWKELIKAGFVSK